MPSATPLTMAFGSLQPSRRTTKAVLPFFTRGDAPAATGLPIVSLSSCAHPVVMAISPMPSAIASLLRLFRAIRLLQLDASDVQKLPYFQDVRLKPDTTGAYHVHASSSRQRVSVSL